MYDIKMERKASFLTHIPRGAMNESAMLCVIFLAILIDKMD